MRKRREKGLVIMLIIIALCLFVLMMPGGFLSRNKSSEWMIKETDKTDHNGKPQNQSGNNGLPGAEPNVPSGILSNETNLPSNVLDKDIAVADSLAMTQEEAIEENMSELTFLVNNLSFERSGSQILIGVVAGLLVLYLVLVGPVAYFYLKKIRKMEHMWFIIPGISLMFGCIILLMSNDFIIREPHVDVIKIISPREKTICYAASTSPGEDSYSLYFEDKVKSLQPWAVADNYVIDEEERSLTLHPNSAFKKEYFQFAVTEMTGNDFVHNIKVVNQIGTGTLYNTTGYAFTHLMLCYEDNYCILPAMNPGDACEVTEQMWKKDEYGMAGSLKEELQIHPGLSPDEEVVFNLAWYRHINDKSYQLHMTGVSKEGDTGLKKNGVNLISYSLFYR